MIRQRMLLQLSLLSLLITFAIVGHASAACSEQSCSTDYGVNEVFFGSGGVIGNSPNYSANESVGELNASNEKGFQYQAYSGFNTQSEPLLEVAVNGGVFDLGNLTSVNTASASTTFSVRNYLSNGYVVQLVGEAPTLADGAHTLASPLSPTTPQADVEQFGVNLAANTAPNIGAAPQQIPSAVYSSGQVAHNYNEGSGRNAISYDLPNNFLFHSGDVVALSSKSTGETVYTLSMIENISTITPGGSYSGSLFVVAAPTF